MQDDGSTLREHLLSEWRQDGYNPNKMPDDLQPVDCSESVMYLWDYFLHMNSRRTSNGFSPNALSNVEVESWARRRNIILEPFENFILDALEQVYLSISNRAKKE